MMNLLDVCVLIALLDESHKNHKMVTGWFKANFESGWMTCPLTENGVLRIMGHPNYPNPATSGPAAVAYELQQFTIHKKPHRFVPDSFSLLEGLPDLSGTFSKDLTDLYLLTLAVRNGAKFVTLDKRIDPSVVPGGEKAYVLL